MRRDSQELKNLKIRLGKLIQEEREASRYSMRQLAQKLDIAYQNISLYEKGKSLPTKRNLKRLIEVLQIDLNPIQETDPELYNYIQDQFRKLKKEDEKVEKLMEDKITYEDLLGKDYAKKLLDAINQMDLNNVYGLNNWVDIPVFASITSGDLTADQNIIGQTKIPSEWLYGQHTFFGLKVNEDRNTPYFMEGDILIAQKVDDNYSIGNGEFIIYNINGSDARVGRYHSVGNQISISFVNELYKPQEISVFDTLKIIGVVKELRRRVV